MCLPERNVAAKFIKKNGKYLKSRKKIKIKINK